MSLKDLMKRWPWAQLLKEELGFLEENGLLNAYLVLISMASSSTDVKKLHALLPENCKIFNKDLSTLKNVRTRATIDNIDFTHDRPFPEAVCQDMLALALGNSTLCSYYRKLLLEGHELSDISSCNLVHAHKENWGYEHFFTKLFETPIDIWVSLSKNLETLAVSLVMWENDLTQTFTHRVLSNEYLRSLKYSSVSNHGRRGHDVNYWITLPAEPFMPVLENHSFRTPPMRMRHHHWVIKDGFTELLETKLGELGLEPEKVLGSITPVLPII